MRTGGSLSGFGALLDKHLPDIADLHRGLRKSGFSAWVTFIDERVGLVPADERSEELSVILLSCREEFCNFTRYSRNVGGDGLQLPALAERRQRARIASPTGAIHILPSEAHMCVDMALSRRYAAATKQAASAALEAERSQLLEAIRTEIARQPTASVFDHVRANVEQSFSTAGFASRPALKSHACFEKAITSSATVIACLEDIDDLGASGWYGDIGLSFYIRPGPALAEHYVKTCCKRHLALPLRLGGLVPGLDAYKSGIYFLVPTSLHCCSAGDVVTLVVYEATASSQEEIARVVAHVGLAVSCFLALFALVEPALTAAVIDLDQTGARPM